MKWVGISLRTRSLPWTAAATLALSVCAGHTSAAATHGAAVSSATPGADLLRLASPFEQDAAFTDLLHPAPLAAGRTGPAAHGDPEPLPAPEPTSLSLLAVGLGIIAVAKRRRQWLR